MKLTQFWDVLSEFLGRIVRIFETEGTKFLGRFVKITGRFVKIFGTCGMAGTCELPTSEKEEKAFLSIHFIELKTLETNAPQDHKRKANAEDLKTKKKNET